MEFVLLEYMTILSVPYVDLLFHADNSYKIIATEKNGHPG